MNDFSKATIRKLAAKGIRLVGPVAIPDTTSSMPWANATRAYSLDNNGCGVIRSFAEVLAMAG